MCEGTPHVCLCVSTQESYKQNFGLPWAKVDNSDMNVYYLQIQNGGRKSYSERCIAMDDQKT